MTRVGIGYRREIATQIWKHTDRIECLEILVEHFLPLTKQRAVELNRLVETFDTIIHGVDLSLGSVYDPPAAYWRDLEEIVRITSAAFFGEHLSVSKNNTHDLWHLSPVWRSPTSLHHCIRRVSEAQERLGIPLAIENITEMVSYGADQMSPEDFMLSLCSATDAYLLLDVSNLSINIANAVLGYGEGYMARLAGLHWAQIHVAGSSRDGDGYLIDSHSEELLASDDAILQAALRIQQPEYIIIERDSNLSEFGSILRDIRRVKMALTQAALRD